MVAERIQFSRMESLPAGNLTRRPMAVTFRLDHVVIRVYDLAAATAASRAALRSHADGEPLGPRAAFTKLLLCTAEQATGDWVLAADPDLAIGPLDDAVAMQRQDYLFSRIVTIYGGSQQMQLETIAKQVLGLP